jgi:hypothetical protein
VFYYKIRKHGNFLNENIRMIQKKFFNNKALSKISVIIHLRIAYNRRDLTYYLSHPLKIRIIGYLIPLL